jgi:hypothetical protein
MYDKVSKQCWYAMAKHKKRITCGDWNSENKFAFASDDRQVASLALGLAPMLFLCFR